MTLDPRQDVITKLIFQISQNKALKRKYMTAYNYFKLSPFTNKRLS